MSEQKVSRSGTRGFISFACGILFALGLGLAGLTNPEKIVHFLNLSLIAKSLWDPTVLLVFVGALAVHIPANIYMKKRAPVLDAKKHLAHQTHIDRRLIVGALIFGVGWALSGFCPGAGLTSVMDGNWPAVTFVIAMTVGMAIHHFYRQLFEQEEF